MKTQRELDAFVAGLREAHREFQGRLTNRGILRVLARERIRRDPMKLPVAAMTVIQYGRASILVDPDRLRNPSEETFVLAEEYAHAKLHAGELDETTIHLSSCGTYDAREYEADYVARSLMAGPGVEVAYFTPSRRKKAVAQPVRLPWWLDPMADPYVNPYRVGRGEWPMHRSEVRGPRRRRSQKKETLLPGEPAIVYGQLFEPTVFRDRDGVKWELHDVTVDLIDGEIKRAEVELGSARATYRYFVGPNQRRSYRLAKWERRDLIASLVERQLRDAQARPVKRPTEVKRRA